MSIIHISLIGLLVHEMMQVIHILVPNIS